MSSQKKLPPFSKVESLELERIPSLRTHPNSDLLRVEKKNNLTINISIINILNSDLKPLTFLQIP